MRVNMEENIKTRKSGINQLAFGSIVFVWGILLMLKQVGIISVSTLPFVFTAFGALFVVSGAVKLGRSRHTEQSIETK
jgi:uncharacterized membrane protein YjjP (DUF1212 family)